MRATLAWIFAHKVGRIARTKADQQRFSSREDFWMSICRDALVSGNLIMTELRVGDRRAAAQWAIRSGDRLHNQMVAWDPHFRRCGPGRLITIETIRWAFDNHIKVYDFGPGGDEHKYRYTGTELAVATEVVLAFPPLDQLLSAGVGTARWLKRRLRNMQPVNQTAQ
jgi:CelD/BcsL family acetyltransferase involved in cellulose biosynthesis